MIARYQKFRGYYAHEKGKGNPVPAASVALAAHLGSVLQAFRFARSEFLRSPFKKIREIA